MESDLDFQKALRSGYEALKIKEKKTEEPGTREKNEENKTSKVTGSNPASSSFSKVLSSVEVRPEIKTFCDKADGNGLRDYIVDNMKEVETIRNELLVALGKSPDAAKLVIKALKGCDLSISGFSRKEKILSVAEELSADNGRACNLLMESLSPVFGNDDSDAVPSDVKDSAREIAKVWWKELKIEKNADSNGAMDVQPFLQLLATFRLAADYEKDELWGLVCIIIRRRQTPELCRSLGLSSKVPDLIHKPIKRCNLDMILRYAHVCGVMDKIEPVVLLRNYLKSAEEGAKVLLTKGHGSAYSQDAANMKMVLALKRVIKLIEEYGLLSHFCEDDLQNKLRILLQEKEALDKKKKQDAKRKAQEKEDRKRAAERKAQEEDRKKAIEKKAREEVDRKKAIEKKARDEVDRKKAAVKKAQETEDRKKAAEKRLQHKGRQSFEPGYGPSERENYASKRAKHASPNVTIKVGSSTGPAAGAFTSAPSIAAQINDERSRLPSVFETSNLTPIGSTYYGSSVFAGAFAVPLYNVASSDGSLGQYSGFVNRNMVPTESSGYSTVPPSSVTQGHFESRRSVIDKYRFNSGSD